MTEPTVSKMETVALKRCPFCGSMIEMEPYKNGKDLVHKVHFGRPRKCTTIYIISNRKYRSKVTEVKIHWNRRERND